VSPRLEMVVGGQRQTALPGNPDPTRLSSPCKGFLLEGHQLSSFELPDHWIPFYLVALQTAGATTTRSFFENGKQRDSPIQNGDCTITAPREVRRFRMAGVGSVAMVSIEPAVLHEMLGGSTSRSFVELTRERNGPDPVLRDLILRLQAESEAGYPNGTLLGESICMMLAEHVLRQSSIGKAHLDQFHGGLSGAQLRRVVEYIDESLSLSLTGDDIANVAGLSKYHFGKAFKQSTGITLHGYVLSRRMARSQWLLAKSHLPLADVAAATGFANQSHLTAMFSTRLGITPRAYRVMQPVSVSMSAIGGKPDLTPARR
jgi:AraC family transcriptional regulator